MGALGVWRLAPAPPLCRFKPCLAQHLAAPWQSHIVLPAAVSPSPSPAAPQQCLCRRSRTRRGEREFGRRVGAAGVGGSRIGCAGEQSSLAASHPLPTSAHLPRGPATCAGCSRAGGSREELGAEEEGVWGGHRPAEAVFPGFLPAGGVIPAQLLDKGSGRPGACAGSRIRMVPDAFWSPC